MTVGTKVLSITYLPNGSRVILSVETEGLKVLGYRATTWNPTAGSRPGKLTDKLTAERLYAKKANVPGAIEEVW